MENQTTNEQTAETMNKPDLLKCKLNEFLTLYEAETGNDKIKIVANTGGRMSFYDCDVIIKAGATISTHTEKPPILKEHNRSLPIGFITSIEQNDNDILIEGELTFDNDIVNDIKVSSKRGFPWQASLGFTVNDFETIDVGEKGIVNGAEEKASRVPIKIANDITIWECSVVTFGADNKTESVVIPAEDTNKLNNEQNEDVVKAIDENEVVEQPTVKQAFSNIEIVKFEKQQLEELRAMSEQTPNINHQRAQFNAQNILCELVGRQLGVKTGANEYELEAADKMQNRDFRGVFEELTGYNATYDQHYNPRLWVEAAASTYNLGGVLSSVANALVLRYTQQAQQVWRDVFKVTSTSNFKTNTRYRLETGFEFEKTARGADAPHATMDSRNYTIKAESFSKQFCIEYQDIKDGEALNVFADTIAAIANGAQKSINRAAWSTFMSNAGDSSTWESSTVASKPLTFANLSAQIAAFITRVDTKTKDKAQMIGVAPAVIVVPPSLKMTAEIILKSTLQQRDGSNVNDFNPLQNYGLKIACPYELENTAYTNYSASSWYLVANPAEIPAFEITFVDGRQAPQIRQESEFIGNRGLEFDGWLDFGVARGFGQGVVKYTA